MMHRLSYLLGRFGTTRAAKRAAAAHAEPWQRAARLVPQILPDLVREGGLLESQPVTMRDGMPLPAPIDPQRLAYEAGRRDLALQLLAAAGLTADDFNSLITEKNDDGHHD